MSQAKQPAVETSGLTKRFRRESGGRHAGMPWRRRRSDLVALHPLDLTLERGSTTGVIGPNGSGVAIARSVLTTPSLLLMDEPTTGLDPRSKREVQHMVTDLRQDSVTTLLCTRDIPGSPRSLLRGVDGRGGGAL
jgi:ABC-type multidrug transport system ATPase subunit